MDLTRFEGFTLAPFTGILMVLPADTFRRGPHAFCAARPRAPPGIYGRKDLPPKIKERCRQETLARFRCLALCERANAQAKPWAMITERHRADVSPFTVPEALNTLNGLRHQVKHLTVAWRDKEVPT